MGHGLSALAQVCEVLGHGCASTAMCFGVHSVGAAMISGKAMPDHAERLLRPIAAGRHLTTLALSEPGTGSHFYLPPPPSRATRTAVCCLARRRSSPAAATPTRTS